MSFADLHELNIETEGIPGYLGRPAATIHRSMEIGGFKDAFWISNPSRTSDLHVIFATEIEVNAGTYRFDVQACGNFVVKVDGKRFTSGPIRFASNLAEYYSQEIDLAGGKHKIVILAHGEALKTRTMAPLPNFVWARLLHENKPIPIHWKAREIVEYKATGLRISPLLGWVEWIDTPIDWNFWNPDLLASEWQDVSSIPELLKRTGPIIRSDLRIPELPEHEASPIAQGKFRDTFTGYALDDLASQFFLANLQPNENEDCDGDWYRYDLGKIRIGNFNLSIDSTSPAVVIIGYGERLTPFGVISPVVPLSTGPTRMIQRFAVATGQSRVEPMQSMGARYVEVRIYAKGEVRIFDETFVERDFLGAPDGRLVTSDDLLNRIWQVGIETMRSSAEDAIVDSVRERAEWIGDIATSGAHLLSSAWGDLALLKRAVLHAAACAREDGMVAGSGPGDLMYLGTYASMWIGLAFHVAEAEGGSDFLAQFEDVARANMNALANLLTPDGVNQWPWPFVDWGHHKNSTNDGSIDAPALLHFIIAIQVWQTWLEILGKSNEAKNWVSLRETLSKVVMKDIDSQPRQYHADTLASLAGLIKPEAAAPTIVAFLTSNFPYAPAGVRLRSPGELEKDLATPYFTNHSLPVLLQAGKGEMVADIWRRNWGWLLNNGATTWWEVFDDRWSHCHYWSSAPTWQLLRFGLGLHPILDVHGSRVELRVNSLGLTKLSGRVRLPLVGWVEVEWVTEGGRHMAYSIHLARALTLVSGLQHHDLEKGSHTFQLVNTPGTDLFK
jgi:hypothetical protein